MTNATHHIVMTASAPTQPSWKWHHERRRVAVVEAERGATPAMISTRARGVVRVVRTWECCYVGTTPACQYQRALSEAERLAAELNREGGR